VKLRTFRGIGAVVTGASSGIGRALALELAAHGARVALVARRRARLDAVAGEIALAGGRALPLCADVSSRSEVENAAKLARAELGPIELLVNNAGRARHAQFLDWDLDDAEAMLAVNLLGAVYWTRALLPEMLERGRGWLVFMASAAGKTGTPYESAYAASKFALVGFAESISHEVEPRGLHVLTVVPGTYRTELFDAEAWSQLPAVALRMLREPEELARRVVRSLSRGDRELYAPSQLRWAQLVRGVAPGLYRRIVRQMTARR